MAKRVFHMGLNSAAESWRAIRNIRADPTSAVRSRMTEDRALVFQTALEQAQQQFTAAASVGYESRPLNLFYGLSQAGRAIAAGSSRLGVQGSVAAAAWVGKGHGLAFQPELKPGVDLLSSPVNTAKRSATKPAQDLFSRVSIALASPYELGPTPLLQILAQLPEYRFEFEDNAPWLPELHLTGIFARTPVAEGPLQLDLELPGLDHSTEVTNAEVTAAADRYPALRGFAVAHNVDGSVLVSNSPPHVSLLVPRDHLRLNQSGSFYLPIGASLYRRNLLVFPTVGDSDEALHPLMSWWLVTYSLSMIARYAPSDWSAALSLSSSSVASKVEHILDTALEVIPDLISEAITNLD